jgi:pyrroline-5-carboxylate reductase
MGEALISGLLRSGARSKDEIMVTCRREERAGALAERYEISATLSNPEAVAEELLGSVGRVIRLREEHQDAVTATSGSGPAYFALLAEAMIDACILLGLDRDIATELIVQTMTGTAKMLRDLGKHPVELREMVTSPGGTTIMAIRHLEQAGVRAAFLNAIDAACRRSAELAIGHEPEEE